MMLFSFLLKFRITLFGIFSLGFRVYAFLFLSVFILNFILRH